jgi:ketosteroid isomerase-like protein
MIQRKAYWLFAAGLVALAGMTHAAPPPSGADEEALRAQTISWAKAYNGGDATAAAAQYADDALLLPPGMPGVRGHAAILAFFIKNVADSKAAGVAFNVDPKTEVGVSGTMGWESGTYTVSVKGTVVESGKFLSVSRKKDGKWHYLRDAWNADASPASPAAAAPQK